MRRGERIFFALKAKYELVYYWIVVIVAIGNDGSKYTGDSC